MCLVLSDGSFTSQKCPFKDNEEACVLYFQMTAPTPAWKARRQTGQPTANDSDLPGLENGPDDFSMRATSSDQQGIDNPVFNSNDESSIQTDGIHPPPYEETAGPSSMSAITDVEKL